MMAAAQVRFSVSWRWVKLVYVLMLPTYTHCYFGDINGVGHLKHGPIECTPVGPKYSIEFHFESEIGIK